MSPKKHVPTQPERNNDTAWYDYQLQALNRLRLQPVNPMIQIIGAEQSSQHMFALLARKVRKPMVIQPLS